MIKNVRGRVIRREASKIIQEMFGQAGSCGGRGSSPLGSGQEASGKDQDVQSLDRRTCAYDAYIFLLQ